MAIASLFFFFLLAWQSTPKRQAAPFWTPAEEKEYQACLPDSLKVWKTRKEAEDYCLLDEEHKRWMRLHPEVAKIAEDKAKYSACIDMNKDKFNNGSREEVRFIYNECQRKAYGLKP
jgi:Zn-dependent M32 family carboxypeptidase